MTPEERIEQKRAELTAKDPVYARYRAAMDAIAKGNTPVIEQAATIREEPAEEPVISTSMSDFVNQHRNEKLPSIQRRHQLIEKQRVALGGAHRR